MIIASHEKTFNWRLCLCELIDNSFDAKATAIRIEMRNREMKFVDNGVGTDSPGILFSQGSRKQHPGTTLGRYGVGASDAFMWLYGATAITSGDGTATYFAQCRWSDVAAMDEWPPVLVREGSSTRGVETGKLFEKTGTCIEILGHTRNNPPYESLIRDLGFIYWPALEHQRRTITFYKAKKGTQVIPFRVPAFKAGESRSVAFEVNGKKVAAHGGNVADGIENRHPGFNISYDYRIICDSDERGAGDMSVSRFFCHVALSPEWTLSRNKDTIGGSARDEDELFEKLNENFGDLIEKSNDQELRLALAGIEGWLEEALNQERDRVSQRRDRIGNKGTHSATGTGTQPGAASKTTAGTKKLKTRRSCISVDIVDGDPELIGYAKANGRGVTVRLHRRFPPVEAALRTPEKPDLRLMALALAAQVQSFRNPTLPGVASAEMEEFVKHYSNGLKLNYIAQPIRKLSVVTAGALAK